MFEIFSKEKETLRLVITGHVDHGKSTLIGRLLLDTHSLPLDKIKELNKISKDFDQETQLAYLTDQLKEEREKNITIDTTEIYLKGKKRNYCLIDTPGHLEFIKNMLTGASLAEAALLIIDVNEGIKEQTLRHAYLLKLLSIHQVIVLLNKMDIVGFDKKIFHQTSLEITSYFQTLDIEISHIIPVSAKQGINVTKKSPSTPWYQGPSLLEAMEALKTSQDFSPTTLRLPVQDAYAMDKEFIIVGRIASGTMKTGQEVRIHPAGQKARIKSIQVLEKKKTQAGCQESIGFTLEPALEIRRGQIVCSAKEIIKPTRRFKGNIFWLSIQSLKKGQKLTVRCSTQTFDATAIEIEQRIDPATLHIIEQDAQELLSNEAGFIKFELTSSAILEEFVHVPELGRYIIEHDHALQGAGTVIAKYE